MGFAAEAEVYISQRRVNHNEDSDAICDAAHGVRLVADAAGRFKWKVLVHHEIFGSNDGWIACDPCVIRALAMRQDPAMVSIEVAADAASGRPTVRILPSGPYEPGQLVELRGSGFQSDVDNIQIAWCRFNTDDPATEAQGAGPDYATCAYPGKGSVHTDDTGAFVVTDFPMPSGSIMPGGATCEAATARCGLAWHPGEGSHPVFITFFEMATG